jgi:4-hydroxy-tetrahydrodipicolinate synthase
MTTPTIERANALSTPSPIKRGTFVISLTPFDAAGEIDETAFRAHLGRLRDAGIGVYVGGSGSGEGYTMTRDETERLLRIAVEELKGKVPVRAMGVEPRTAKQMIEFLALAKDCGVDAAQVYSLDVGHDVAPTPQEAERYLGDVLEAAELPVAISTHFSVGYKQPIDLLAKLVDRYPNIVGINCTHPDLHYLSTLIDQVADRVQVMVGGPMQGLTVLALGGHGYLSSEGNIAPRLCVSVIDRFEAKDIDGMMDAFGRLIRLFGAALSGGGTRVTKSALNRLGLAGGTSRLPRLIIEDERLDRLLATIEQLDIPRIEGWQRS